MHPARRILFTALSLLPFAGVSSSKDTLPVAATNIYPYLVAAGYPEPQGAVHPVFGHGVRVALVFDMGGMVKSVTSDDLAAIGLSWGDARAKAEANLEGLLRNGTVSMTVFENGPSGRPFVLVGGHWAAATCVLLPGMRAVAGRALGNTAICASIPHRGALLIFPKGDRVHRDAMRAMIRSKEGDGEKPLTFGLFELTDAGPVPLSE